ncbi:MmgE/PrpD family protein [Roseovarius sp. S88]|uniref:MmgE/PrpD family protein n=2 Tax=Roseovarius phycicola TaxID=3080976 RepID=A0ABZ2HCC1_9RHOB
MAMAELSETLSDFAISTRFDDDALEIMRLSMLDWAAVAIAGQNEPVAQILRDQAQEEGGAPEAGLVGTALRVPARMAAMVNGTISHALDYDDTHFAHIGHPSVAVVPAALATAERVGASGDDVQQAALVGVEASIRVGVWLGRGHYQTGFHQTATAGAFGATLGAGRLLGLDAAQMRSALGLVATRTSGLKSQFGTMGKPFNAGLAASNGVEAAVLTAKGFVSNPSALEAAQGFGPTHHGAGDLTALNGLGQEWLFPTVQHKFHACCHGLHATLEALAECDAPPDAIAKVQISTHPRWMTVCNIAQPTTGLKAKFSYAQVVAMRLLGYDTARLDSFTDALTQDPAVIAMRQKVEVVEDNALSEMQARVDVTLRTGDVVTLSHDLDTPVPLEARTNRIKTKATSLLGASRAEALWDLIDTKAPPRDFAAALVDPA